MVQTRISTDQWARLITEQVSRVIAGKEDAVRWILTAILAGGHILLEDIPGVGKTTLALTLAEALGLSFGRVQFTPDVMPSDVVGYSVPVGGQMVYRSGAVMCNLLLADELNRANAKTQSALLEAMEEGQVTVDGVSHTLPRPFVVVATQNPYGAAGTQPLPDSQMDRFALRTSLGYPTKGEERNMILEHSDQIAVTQIMTAKDLLDMQAETEKTYISEAVADYIVRLVSATRKDFRILRGASPRTTLSLAAMAKAAARLEGRDFVIPEDVRRCFLRGVPHRILAQGDAATQLRRILRWVRGPKEQK